MIYPYKYIDLLALFALIVAEELSVDCSVIDGWDEVPNMNAP